MVVKIIDCSKFFMRAPKHQNEITWYSTGSQEEYRLQKDVVVSGLDMHHTLSAKAAGSVQVYVQRNFRTERLGQSPPPDENALVADLQNKIKDAFEGELTKGESVDRKVLETSLPAKINSISNELYTLSGARVTFEANPLILDSAQKKTD